MSQSSSRRESLIEVKERAFCSAMLFAPPYTVAQRMKSLEFLKDYGVESGVIKCCVMETAGSPSAPASVRRCVLGLAPYADALLREKLQSFTQDVDVGEDGAPIPETLRVAKLTLEYMSPHPAEKHRSPFPPNVETALQSVTTTFRVSPVTRGINRCYIEADTVAFMRVHRRSAVDREILLEEAESRRAVGDFWQTYLNGQLRSLEAMMAKEYHPYREDRLSVEFNETFRAHEEKLCSWGCRKEELIPVPVVVEELEQALVGWSRVLQEYRHQKLLAEAAQTTTDSVAGATSRQSSAKLVEKVRPRPSKVEAQTSYSPPHSPLRPGQAFCSSTKSDRPLKGIRTSPSSIADHFRAMNEAGDATGSSHPASHCSTNVDSRRLSVLTPRDRRYTAVPKKSLTALLPSDDAPRMANTGQSKVTAPVSLTLANAALPAVGGFVAGVSTTPNSTGSIPSTRWKSSALRHPSLLIPRSRMSTSAGACLPSRLSSRVSQLSKATESTPSSEKAGLFFSQLFNTEGPTTRAVAPLGAAAGPDVSDATAASPRSSCAAEGFQPEVVRKLFTISGVLREDVARRIFLSLCDDAAAVPPVMSSSSLKRLLQCIDPCGLLERDPRKAEQAAAIAEEDAYRAEVERCYDEQKTLFIADGVENGHNSRKSASTAARKPPFRDSGFGSGLRGICDTPPTAFSSVSPLRDLTARRQNTRQAMGEAALDQLTQSTMKRFCLRKKNDLTFDEFCLALLHLSHF